MELPYNEHHDLFYNTPKPISLGDHIKEDEVGCSCSTYGGYEKCMQGLGVKTCKKQNTWKI